MSRLKRINERIESKLKELEQDKQDRIDAREVTHNIQARREDVLRHLGRVRARIQKRRAVLQELREDLEEANAATPGEDTEEEAKLAQRLDRLSGELEEDIAVRGRLLLRLDRLAERDADAKQRLAEIVRESEDDRRELTRMRVKRDKIREQIAANDRPSPNFSWPEFYCNDGTPFPDGAKDAIRAWCRDIGEPARREYGPIHINSAHRHAAYNARIGGEPNSVHIYNAPGRIPPGAVAVDWTAARGTARDWYTFTANKADGRGLYATFTHSDNRNRIGWPDSTWSG